MDQRDTLGSPFREVDVGTTGFRSAACDVGLDEEFGARVGIRP
jgi:hypothetical protein